MTMTQGFVFKVFSLFIFILGCGQDPLGYSPSNLRLFEEFRQFYPGFVDHGAQQRWVIVSQRNHQKLHSFSSVTNEENITVVKTLLSGEAMVVETKDLVKLLGLAQDFDLIVEPDFKISLDHSVDEKSDDSRIDGEVTTKGLKQIEGHNLRYRGKTVKVCVSDTGIDLDHPDLKENVIDHFSTINNVESGDDDQGHGSHVAGIIAAVRGNGRGLYGVASSAKLIAAKGISKEGYGSSSDLAATIDGCRTRKAHVINMSWGSIFESSLIKRAVEKAAEANIIMIAAAGNNGEDEVSYPARFPEVVAVSAVDYQDDIVSWSNRGWRVENSAPGYKIYSTYKDGEYAALSGTSMASPFVAGVAAVIRSRTSRITREDLRGDDIELPLSQQGKRYRINSKRSLESL